MLALLSTDLFVYWLVPWLLQKKIVEPKFNLETFNGMGNLLDEGIPRIAEDHF